MGRRVLAALVAVGLFAASAGSAWAIIWGEPDAGRHPYVAMLAAFNADGTYAWRCTGSLVSPTVVVTAGHCTYGAATVRVHLDEVVTTNYRNPSTGLVGTPHTDPQFVGPGGALVGEVHDLGVVVLSQPAALTRYGRLPPLDYLDGLVTRAGVKGVGLTVVGYGLQDMKPTVVAETRRLMAQVWVLTLHTPLAGGAQVGTTNARGTGGGVCFGDSGGPFLYGGDTVVGVTKWGLNLRTCDGTAFAYRTDTASARAFLGQFVALP
jgi:secreted trypsin-like serine protease